MVPYQIKYIDENYFCIVTNCFSMFIIYSHPRNPIRELYGYGSDGLRSHELWLRRLMLENQHPVLTGPRTRTILIC